MDRPGIGLLVLAAVLAATMALLAPSPALRPRSGRADTHRPSLPGEASRKLRAITAKAAIARGHGHRDGPLFPERRQAAGDGLDHQDHDGHPHPGIDASRPEGQGARERQSAWPAPRWAPRGESFTVKQLLYAMLVPSANDAAVTLAVAEAGSVKAFVAKMNAKAEEMGLTNTHFVNPSGLHAENHYSSAKDMATLASYAMQDPVFRRIVSTREYTLPARRWCGPAGHQDQQRAAEGCSLGQRHQDRVDPLGRLLPGRIGHQERAHPDQRGAGGQGRADSRGGEQGPALLWVRTVPR